MTLRDSIQTHFLGSLRNIETWRIFDWVYISIRIAILCFYVFLETFLSGSQRIAIIFSESAIFHVIFKLIWTTSGFIPFLGEYIQYVLARCLNSLSSMIIPFFEKISLAIMLYFQLHIVEMTLKEKKSVQIFVTAESDELKFYDEQNMLMTTLLLANHRSLSDYILINYLIQQNGTSPSKTMKKYEIVWNFYRDGSLPFPELKFISWGKIVNFPQLSLLKNIILKDENYHIGPDKLKDQLNKSGNEVMAIFPEVNIMTTELGMVQRKLNQDQPFVTKFYNVLYPRFQGFISIIKCFAHINKVKRREHFPLAINNFKKLINDRVDKLLVRVASNEGDSKEQRIAQASMVLGLQHNYDCEDKHASCPKFSKTSDSIKDNLNINKELFDLTIVYYKPRRIELHANHDHTNGQFKLHNGYRLEQVNPSLIEMLRPERHNFAEKTGYTTTKPPIVIMVHIKKHELGPLLVAKGRNLEKWLENQWFQKDKLIDYIENGIKIK